ncbi:MAG: hypothetical protein ACXAB7_18140 [Candidatus Kariarchaeaceae archaeon]
MSDELEISLSKLVQRNRIMEIAEVVSPYFRTKKKDAAGNAARFISVKDIQFNQYEKGNATEYDVTIQLLSDQGSWTDGIIIREFDSGAKLEAEMTNYNQLQSRLNKYPTMQLLPMINIDRENKRIVYEKQTGYTIDQLDLSQNLTDFFLGQLTASLHGGEYLQLESTTLQTLIDFLLAHLAFTDEERSSLSYLLEPHLQSVRAGKGGYAPYTSFDFSNFHFVPQISKETITKANILSGKAVKSIIRIDYPEAPIVDRMTDISSIFCRAAYSEFLSNGKMKETVNAVYNFLEGYEARSDEMGYSSLLDMYPIESTLNLQMLVNFWLIEINKLQGIPGGATGFEGKESIQYAYFLLLQKPFSFD